MEDLSQVRLLRLERVGDTYVDMNFFPSVVHMNFCTGTVPINFSLLCVLRLSIPRIPILFDMHSLVTSRASMKDRLLFIPFYFPLNIK